MMGNATDQRFLPAPSDHMSCIRSKSASPKIARHGRALARRRWTATRRPADPDANPGLGFPKFRVMYSRTYPVPNCRLMVAEHCAAASDASDGGVNPIQLDATSQSAFCSHRSRKFGDSGNWHSACVADESPR